ncbi:hypothetical protein T484DRAFT_1840453, partial [Baffinella frigidus]
MLSAPPHLRSKIRPGRPTWSPTQSPAAWWKYVVGAVISDVRERRARRSKTFLLQRRATRLRYVELYLKLRHGEEELGRRGRKELDAIEEGLRAHDIIYFRCTAIKKARTQTSGVRRRKPKGWFAWARRGKEEEEEDEQARAPPPPRMTHDCCEGGGGAGMSVSVSKVTLDCIHTFLETDDEGEDEQAEDGHTEKPLLALTHEEHEEDGHTEKPLLALTHEEHASLLA